MLMKAQQKRTAAQRMANKAVDPDAKAVSKFRGGHQ